jgi:hypothetical protein
VRLADDARVRRHDGGPVARGRRRARAGRERVALRERRLQRGGRLVDGRLAHELLRGQRQVAIVHALRVREVRLGLGDLRAARRERRVRRARVDAGHDLSGADRVAGLDRKLDDATRDLHGERRLPHRLDRRLDLDGLRELARRDAHRLERGRRQHGEGGERQDGGEQAVHGPQCGDAQGRAL